MGTAIAGSLAVFALIWRMVSLDPAVNYLADDGVSQWIICPRNLDPQPSEVVELHALFRRQFNLDAVPASAPLSYRAFKRCVILINGEQIAFPAENDANWKSPVTMDAARFLKQGNNEIAVTVFNDRGPPALSLSLDAGATKIISAPDWQSSFGGIIWRPARLARLPIPRKPPAIPDAGPLDAFRANLPSLLVVFLVALALVCAIERFVKIRFGADAPQQASAGRNLCKAAFVCVVSFWTAMFVNNLGVLPLDAGFDSIGHIKYVEYIQQKNSLPLADEGWQMYHPPLYYLLSAVALKILGIAAAGAEGVTALRCFGMVLGLVQIYFVMRVLRVLFPEKYGMHLAGLLLASFLPVQLYLCQLVTNEMLAALFVTLAAWFLLRLLEKPGISPGLSAAVGLCLGASLLTKFSAFVVLPVFFVVLAAKAFVTEENSWNVSRIEPMDLPDDGKQSISGSATVPVAVSRVSRDTFPYEVHGKRGTRFDIRGIMPALVCMVLVCGWHYWRVDHKFHNPLITNWELPGSAAYWQDEGCRTGAYYTRFGEVFFQPLNGTTTSFWDGIYSTLWGDGLTSGAIAREFGPAWNYQAMNAGYVLALVPAFIIAIGIVITLWNFITRPDCRSFLILGTLAASLFLLFYLTLRVPAWSSAKASYCLQALAPFCILGALGWDFCRRKSGIFGLLLSALLLTWAFNCCRTFWISRKESHTFFTLGAGSPPERYERSRTALLHAVELDPSNFMAINELGNHTKKMGQINEAAAAYSAVLKDKPDDVAAHLGMARILIGKGDLPGAIVHFRDAVKRDPENLEALKALSLILSTAPQDDLRNGPEAVRFAEEACELSRYHDPRVIGLLAIAYAENREFLKAPETARESSRLAKAFGNEGVAQWADGLAALFETGKTSHEAAAAASTTNAP